ncbi:hypothetical protein PAEPH01_0002 [Pancytospora epiphaga]|nr:hypothetical protein PAEPH01_0002 [Pancytospora epiphaga]
MAIIGRLETPYQFLENMRGRQVRVILKWGTVYKGEFVCYDKYMNIVLIETLELTQTKEIPLGEVWIRHNNVKMIEKL